LNDDGSTVEEDNISLSVERYYENLINDNDNVFYASNVDVDINDLFVPPLDIYDLKNLGILGVKTKYVLIEKEHIRKLNLTFSIQTF